MFTGFFGFSMIIYRLYTKIHTKKYPLFLTIEAGNPQKGENMQAAHLYISKTLRF